MRKPVPPPRSVTASPGLPDSRRSGGGPTPQGAYPWPEGVPRAVTVEAFLAAFATLNYQACETADPETGVEKLAIYCLAGKPTHAARQLPDGRWTSKAYLQTIRPETSETVRELLDHLLVRFRKLASQVPPGGTVNSVCCCGCTCKAVARRCGSWSRPCVPRWKSQHELPIDRRKQWFACDSTPTSTARTRSRC
jgi:hypothetical protein